MSLANTFVVGMTSGSKSFHPTLDTSDIGKVITIAFSLTVWQGLSFRSFALLESHPSALSPVQAASLAAFTCTGL